MADTRRARLGLTLASLAVASACAAVAAYVKRASAGSGRLRWPGKAARDATAGGAIPAAAPPDADLPRLAAITGKVAAAHGDTSARTIATIATTHARAHAITAPGDPEPRSATGAVYLVIMRGQFTSLNAPPGGRGVTGSYLSIVLDPGTLRVLDLRVSRHEPATLPARERLSLG